MATRQGTSAAARKARSRAVASYIGADVVPKEDEGNQAPSSIPAESNQENGGE